MKLETKKLKVVLRHLGSREHKILAAIRVRLLDV